VVDLGKRVQRFHNYFFLLVVQGVVLLLQLPMVRVLVVLEVLVDLGLVVEVVVLVLLLLDREQVVMVVKV
jgi:hypothetical protein